MPIKYYLQPNPITPDPNDQSARVSRTDKPSVPHGQSVQAVRESCASGKEDRTRQMRFIGSVRNI